MRGYLILTEHTKNNLNMVIYAINLLIHSYVHSK